MNVEELREYCLAIKGASEGFPFAKFGRGAENILVFKVMDKMFAYIDLFPSNLVFQVWLKCDPQYSQKLCNQYEGIIFSSRNLGKYWIGVELASGIPDPLIHDLIINSVKEVISKLPKQKQKEYYS